MGGALVIARGLSIGMGASRQVAKIRETSRPNWPSLCPRGRGIMMLDDHNGHMARSYIFETHRERAFPGPTNLPPQTLSFKALDSERAIPMFEHRRMEPADPVIRISGKSRSPLQS